MLRTGRAFRLTPLDPRPNMVNNIGEDAAASPPPKDEPMADGRTDFPLPVGERLRQARLSRRLSLDDVAARTRVPTRHLDAIERGDWDDLPAPTYSIGFAKAYADVVGLDRQEVGDELRAELGGGRAPAVTETFQPADPARVPSRSGRPSARTTTP